VEAANLWSFFQARTIRQTTLRTAAEEAELGRAGAADPALREAIERQQKAWRDTIARWESEPATGEGHGSANLVIHETAHGVDYSQTPHISAGAPFNAARTPDVGALPAYETQPSNAGQEESFAESCARFYSNDPFSAESTPHLHKYWRDNPLGPPDPTPTASEPVDGSALETEKTEMVA
jgi:hypothetical protein